MVANIYTYPALSAAAAAVAGTPAQQIAGAAPLKCPRCDSMSTKFCYYNNYSLAQPRHFCKSCKRYWTRGGTLRNIPVGGSCRKNKRHKKPQSSTVPKSLLRRPVNSLPSLPAPATDLSSLNYRAQPISWSNLFFPRLDLDAQLAGHEEIFQSCIGGHLFDVQKSAAAGESYQAPLLSYDDLSMGKCEEMGLIKENPMEAIYSGDVSGAATPVESAYLYWNQAGVSNRWPEFSSSVAPLL